MGKEPESRFRGGFLSGIFLCFSVILNLSSMASLIDGFVTWADFFNNFISLYRSFVGFLIVEPINYVFSVKIPQIICDLLIVNSVFFLCVLIAPYFSGTDSLWKIASESLQNGMSRKRLFFQIFIQYLLQPIVFLAAPIFWIVYGPMSKEAKREFMGGVYALGFIICIFVFILFLNFQMLKYS